MSNESVLESWLMQWEELREQGRSVSLEELCAQRPELAGELQQRIGEILALEGQLSSWNRSKESTFPSKEKHRPAFSGTIPGYELLEELGRGAMGVVYKARQVSLNRIVALKMILAGEFAGPVQLARFRTEAEAVARLQHPHIVQIFECGDHDGLPYFSLEYVNGGNLAQWTNAVPQPPRESARLVETLARAVHAAHLRGIIHRDLKPANVLLALNSNLEIRNPKQTPSMNEPNPKLQAGEVSSIGHWDLGLDSDFEPRISDFSPKIADFGLAKQIQSEPGVYGPGWQTQTGSVLGTPSYMAPEQASGRGRAIGPAADIYALGAILYEMLTGRPPFKAETPMETIHQVLTEEPVSLTRLQSKVPRDLETICLKCLQKESNKRYPNAEALAEDLRRFLAGEPIRARPVQWWEKGLKWTRRRPALAGLVAFLFLAAMAFAGGVVFHTVQLQQAFNDVQREQNKVKDREFKIRQHLYPAEMNLGEILWQRGDLAQARERLANYVPGAGEEEDYRGFEWGYLNRLCGESVDRCILRGHQGPVFAAAFSPDCCTLASAGQDGNVVLWNVQTREVKAVFKDNQKPIKALAFAPDDNDRRAAKALVTVNEDGVIQFLDPVTGSVNSQRPGEKHPQCAALSADGSFVALAFGNQIKIREIATEKEFILTGHQAAIEWMAFSPDGITLLCKDRDEFKTWHLPTRVLNFSMTAKDHLVTATGNPNRASQVPIGEPKGKIQIKLHGQGEPSVIFQAHLGAVRIVTYAPTGNILASLGEDGILKLWEEDGTL
jgi:eukaryotic-like serine/threonine-protein kinase